MTDSDDAMLAVRTDLPDGGWTSEAWVDGDENGLAQDDWVEKGVRGGRSTYDKEGELTMHETLHKEPGDTLDDDDEE